MDFSVGWHDICLHSGEKMKKNDSKKYILQALKRYDLEHIFDPCDLEHVFISEFERGNM